MSELPDNVTIVPLDLAYKGGRNYIHGTSVYEQISGYIKSVLPERALGTFRLVIHSFAKNQCEFHYVIDSKALNKPERGCIEIVTSTGICGWLVESGDEIINRTPFPEDEIIAECQLGADRSVSLMAELSFQPIEMLVAMTKHLHIAEYTEEGGKWVFARLDLNRFLTEDDVSQMSIKIEQSIGTRLTKSAVFSGKEQIGDIYFSMVTKWPK